MARGWSPLHAALGLGEGPLAYEHFQQAVLDQVQESAFLDWKRSLPVQNPSSLDEFAKDVAAMANSGGGVLVFGVTELRGQGSARAIEPVPLDERSIQQLRAALASRVRPMVTGNEFVLVKASNVPEGILVLNIPASANAPHFVGDANRLGAPYRDGPTTRWMTERQIERTYLDRFTNREAVDGALETLKDDMLDRVDRSAGPWLTLVATPDIRYGRSAQLDEPGIQRLMLAALGNARTVSPESVVIIKSLGEGGLRPRVGLRRWVMATDRFGEPGSRSDWSHAEVHHDGTVALGICTSSVIRRAAETEGAHGVDAIAIEYAVISEFSILFALASEMGSSRAMQVRMDISVSDGRPLALLDEETIGGLRLNNLKQLEASRTIPRFVPVMSSIIPIPENIEEDAARVALDALNQFGVNRLHALPRPKGG